MRRLTVGRGQAVVADVEVLVCFRLLRLHRVVGADSGVHGAGDGGQDGARRRQGRGGGLSGDGVADLRRRPASLRLLLCGFLLLLLLLLLPLLRLPPQLLSLPLDGRHPVPYGLGHELEVRLAHKAQPDLRKQQAEKRSGHNRNVYIYTTYVPVQVGVTCVCAY